MRDDPTLSVPPPAAPPPGPARTRPRLAPQPSCERVLRLKYLGPGEAGVQALYARVAWALCQAEGPPGHAHTRLWEQRFVAALQAGFMPGGRILAAAGRGGERCWMNCFVQPLGGPLAPPGSHAPGLEVALDQTLTTLRRGGGVGLDLSWRDDVLQVLDIFDKACGRISKGASRRGALMGVLQADHPQWAAFIDAKRKGGLSHFNLSVAVSDAFMRRVFKGDPDASARWHALVHAAWAVGEPGLLFLDAMQRDDCLAWRERLVATNPCGEQPLPPHGSCCLGSLDLTRFVRAPLHDGAHLDLAALARTASVGVRMLDNVITLTPWPLAVQREEALATRRIGLGFTGLGDALALLGVRYDQPQGRAQAAAIARTLRDVAVRASVALARERGPYPLFDAARHLAAPGFASRLPSGLRSLIRRHGLRNSHLLSIAPAGSISLALADNTSSGIEPVWAWHLTRPIQGWRKPLQRQAFDNHAWRLWRHGHRDSDALPRSFVTADDITPADQVDMVAAVAPFVDGGIAKTVQLRHEVAPSEVAEVFRRAWASGLKGITVFRTGAARDALLQPAGCHNQSLSLPSPWTSTRCKPA